MSGSPSDLCLACGLCCDGTLFDHARVTKAEAKKLKGTAVELVVDSEGHPALRQPCGALKSKCCTVYEKRPKECRSFKCNLYVKVERGDLSVEEALPRIDEALALAAQVGLSIEDGPFLKQLLQKAWRGSPDDPGRAEMNELADLLVGQFLPESSGA